MGLEDSYTRFVIEHTTAPPRTSGETLHWDGLGTVSQGMGLTSPAGPMVHAAVPAQGQLVARDRTLPSMTLQQRSRLAVPPAPAIDWATEAATVTFYVPLGVLRATRDTVVVGATGTMVWVSQAEEAGIIPTVHPALLVQTVFATLQEACVELVPHLPADDPLRHHMGLVLQTAFEAEDATSQLYVASLADALAAHFLHRYRACRHPAAHEVIGGLSPIKLQRTTAYIQAHLEQELCLTTLAALVHLSPDHFARLFKQATGRTPHQYVLECRIARAKRLLAETDLPLSTISLQVGCADQSYFTALFRKHVAMTPKAYRDTRVQV